MAIFTVKEEVLDSTKISLLVMFKKLIISIDYRQILIFLFY